VAPDPSGWVASFYFVTVVLVGTMVMLNLFIGVIINSMEEAKLDVQRDKEMRRSAKPALTAEDELARLNNRLGELQKELEFTLYRLKKTNKEKT
jgi:voltage-gated sodium channel